MCFACLVYFKCCAKSTVIDRGSTMRPDRRDTVTEMMSVSPRAVDVKRYPITSESAFESAGQIRSETAFESTTQWEFSTPGNLSVAAAEVPDNVTLGGALSDDFNPTSFAGEITYEELPRNL